MAASFPCRAFWGVHLPLPKVCRIRDVICETDHLASRQIAEHLQARGWTDTLFHGFLNNKNNFKAAGWSRGSSPWLLDEPANFQDY